MARSIRDVYGDLLVQLGKENERIVVLDADVSSSTKSGAFGKAYPDRFFNVGIAEANMVAMAAGLATTGKIPFANTFAVFITSIGLISARAFGSYSKLNIKLMGAYCGLSDSFDGPSHHALEDLAIMRALPNFEVLVATDEVQTEWLIRYAAAKEGPMYIRLSRDATLPVYQPGTVFEPGKGKVVREGSDACVLACGGMVGYALEAAKNLAARGISIRVVDLFSIKPLDSDLILQSAAHTGAIVTAEEHNIYGGLGSAVAEVLAAGRSGVPVTFVGIRDTHAESGPYADLLSKYGLDVVGIEQAVEAVVREKG
jgi:transketolase